jgi:hypothetical protein
MSVSGIAAIPNSYQPLGTRTAFQQDFGTLVSSLNSGNLSGAQAAYSSLSQLQGNGQGSSTSPDIPFGQALSQIGQDLQSGNLTGAQQALSSLQQLRGSHHHGHHGGSNTSQPPASAATVSGPAASTTNILNVTA